MKSWEELLTPPNDDTREKFFAFLLRRPCTRKQAVEYLSRMKFPETLIDEAEDAGLIDDLGYARLFADGHVSWGNAKIAYELGVRGVSRENVRIALDEIDDEEERAREISESLRKSGLDERKIRARLISRGFSSRAVYEVLEE
ncbi:MAG: RecX family transcriptional regulator [Synergistaceae bacterium]|nr:RecX family transcriptional regulator [Synergistaceae bacterium]MBQ3398188.1 RecX family transcriptional regulator [Synergistaceae bacterium]MBQ3759018.1 RecX family transcriptional regulator [Synergistaceae bacterium]MBQ6115636.1 RecX family transcriptional regulator [Synergistaceae bacterium]MBQ6418280.1 RecX family transcriptional regulator [Synergistaceae bacterium]